MAITTTTIQVAAGTTQWLPSDVIVGIESAFTWLGWHNGTSVTGIVTGISAVSGGGTITGSAYSYENNGNGQSFYYSDVPQSSSSGIGTGATFSIRRVNGAASWASNQIYVNRPGYGYTTGEVVQISAADIGGSANGAIGIAVTVRSSAVGYGTTNAFFAKDLGGGISGTPWGVLKLQHQADKKYGNTYYGFQVVNYNSNYPSFSNPTGFALKFASGSDFHPYTVTNTNSLGIGYSSRFCGNGLDDGVISPGNLPPTFYQLQLNSNDGSTAVNSSRSYKFRSQFASSLNYPLNINIYRSAIDTNFAVISFAQPGITAAQLSTNSFCTFFIHKYSSTLWDLDNVFLEGITQIVGETGNASYPAVRFTSWIGGNATGGDYSSGQKRAWRAAEAGYMIPGTLGSKEYQLTSRYTSTTYYNSYNNTIESSSGGSSNVRIYNRNSSDINQSAKVGTAINYVSDGESSQSVTSSANYNAVIKGIPLSTVMVPSPYYLPDDFVFIDFDSGTDQQIIQQGDTVTVSGGEVYTVITGSYNQTSRTRGVLFCARKV